MVVALAFTLLKQLSRPADEARPIVDDRVEDGDAVGTAATLALVSD